MIVALAAATVGFLLCAAALAPLDGAASALALVAFALGVGLESLALPVLSLGARMGRLSRGETVLRSESPLPEAEAREVFRLVDLVRGRLRQAAPGLDEGSCEVWLCRRPGGIAALRRAFGLGVGRLGAAVCPIPERALEAPDALVRGLSDALARNAAAGLGGRLRGFLREGLCGWLAVCGASPIGPRRRLALHAEAAELGPGGRSLLEWLTQPAPGPPGPERTALARSFTGFLVERYGLPAYLRLLTHADGAPAHVALLLAYGREPADLERRWRIFLETGRPVASVGGRDGQ